MKQRIEKFFKVKRNRIITICGTVAVIVVVLVSVLVANIKSTITKLTAESGITAAVTDITNLDTSIIETTTEVTTQPTTTAAPTTTKAATTKPATTKAPATKATAQNEARTDASGGKLFEADVPGQNCPYPLCVWTTYTTNTGKTIEGYFVAQTSPKADQRNVYIQNTLPRVKADPSLKQVSYSVGSYEDTGDVVFMGIEK